MHRRRALPRPARPGEVPYENKAGHAGRPAAAERDVPGAGAPNGRQGLAIWDEVYPCVCLPGDIRAGRLFVLEEGGAPKAAFALYRDEAAAAAMGWQAPAAPALYLARLAVAPACQRTGLGSRALRAAMALAAGQGAQYLRLFVVDTNAPALAFYRKNGFCKAGGCRKEDVGTGMLRELGFEVCLAQAARAR